MRKDFYFFGNTPEGGSRSACTYYRVDVLMEGLKTLTPTKSFRRHVLDKPEDFIPAALACDVFHSYSLVGEPILEQHKTFAQMKAGIQGDGKIKIPPVTIWDCDDNTDFVHPTNSTYARLGVRAYPDLEFLEPGDSVEMKDAQDRPIVMWEDKVSRDGDGLLFDIERNLEFFKLKNQVIRSAQGITVPSPVLASYFREVYGCKHVHVFPNTVIPEHYREFPLVPHDPEEIWVLWQGSMSHYIDWYPLRDAVKTICDKYPKVKWLIWGDKFAWIHDVIPADRIKFTGWVPYDAYKLHRGLMQADINICPLADNIFNRCKSAIKWYEGSIWKNPEATLAANVSPYKDEMIDGETGMLYNDPEDFVRKLSLLIEDAELRKRLGANAKKWVFANRTIHQTIPPLMEFYKELQAVRAREALDETSENVQRLAQNEGYGRE